MKSVRLVEMIRQVRSHQTLKRKFDEEKEEEKIMKRNNKKKQRLSSSHKNSSSSSTIQLPLLLSISSPQTNIKVLFQ